MNTETGEIMDALKEADRVAKSDVGRWVNLRVGDEVQILGVPCRLVNMNVGRKRLTFTPAGSMPMPRSSADPVIGVGKSKGKG